MKEGLRDWNITRTLDWGVKFPGHDDLVVYVWVDAPIGYISFTEEWARARGLDWKRYWCGKNRVTHFIGSDIIYHHCIFWPALLTGAGYTPPLAVVASGMVKIDDQKFSKSRGYVVWTGEDYLDKGLPPDYLRYYLLWYTNHTKELNFSWQVFSERVNNELVSTLGNFIYRSLFFAHKFFGKIPEGPVGAATVEAIERCVEEMDRSVREFEFKGAIDAMMALAAYGNTYIQNQAPWKLMKTDPAAAGKVVKDCLQIAHALALLMEPVLPDASGRVWRMLGNTDAVEGHPLSDASRQIPSVTLPEPSPLFEKLEDSRIRGSGRDPEEEDREGKDGGKGEGPGVHRGVLPDGHEGREDCLCRDGKRLEEAPEAHGGYRRRETNCRGRDGRVLPARGDGRALGHHRHQHETGEDIRDREPGDGSCRGRGGEHPRAPERGTTRDEDPVIREKALG